MLNHQVLVFTALPIFVFGLFSRVSERWAITGPMVFMIVGIAVSPLGFGLFAVHPTGDLVKLVLVGQKKAGGMAVKGKVETRR